jgi:P27 family predicted phage terminase small subunit
MNYSKETEQYMSVIEKQMESLGVLEDADKENLKLLKIQIELYYRAVDELEKNGLTAYDKVGRLSVNPAFTIQRSAMVNIISLLKELSLSARQRRLLTSAGQTNEDDPMDVFLKEMQND